MWYIILVKKDLVLWKQVVIDFWKRLNDRYKVIILREHLKEEQYF